MILNLHLSLILGCGTGYVSNMKIGFIVLLSNQIFNLGVGRKINCGQNGGRWHRNRGPNNHKEPKTLAEARAQPELLGLNLCRRVSKTRFKSLDPLFLSTCLSLCVPSSMFHAIGKKTT